jgi:hypothetical protein
VDSREECRWSHACSLQANMRGIQWHPRVQNPVRKFAPYPRNRRHQCCPCRCQVNQAGCRLRLQSVYCMGRIGSVQLRRGCTFHTPPPHPDTRAFSVWTQVTVPTGKRSGHPTGMALVTCMFASSEHAWDPMASSSVDFCLKTRTVHVKLQLDKISQHKPRREGRHWRWCFRCMLPAVLCDVISVGAELMVSASGACYLQCLDAIQSANR